MTDYRTGRAEPGAHQHAGGHGSRTWLMAAWCIPLLGIALVLSVTGVVGAGLVFAAVACMVMMALMMRGMDHGGGQAHDEHSGRDRAEFR